MDSCNAMEMLHNTLIQTINNSGLSVGAGLFIVKDIYNSLYLLYLEQLKKEKENQSQESIQTTIEAEIDPDIQEEE